MKKSLKFLTIIVTLLVSTSLLLSGCGTKDVVKETSAKNSTGSKPDISKKVNLKFYFVFAKEADSDKVLAEINKKLLAKINTTISVEYLATPEKYALAFASGDDFDAIYAADWMLYGQQASKNGYLEITKDLLTKYAPNVEKNTPQSAWDQTKINGKVYMVPQLQDEFAQIQMAIRGDLRKKYNVPPVTDVKSLEVYLDAIAKNEKGMSGWSGENGQAQFLLYLWKQATGTDTMGAAGFPYAYYNYTEPANYKVLNYYDQPFFAEGLNTIRTWNQKGYIAKSTLTNNTIDQSVNFDNGKSALFVQNMNSCNIRYANAKANHPDWSIELIDATANQKVLGYKASSGGLGIHSTSKNADRVLMAVDYLRYDKDANFLAQRGIKGENWNIAPGQSNENVVVAGPDIAKYDGGDSFTWGPWRNSQFQTFPAENNALPGFNELFKSLKSRVVSHPFQAFQFNNEKVKAEVAAIKSVDDQYFKPLVGGYVDPATGIAVFKEKLKAAGYDKVMAELQTQVDAYVKTLK